MLMRLVRSILLPFVLATSPRTNLALGYRQAVSRVLTTLFTTALVLPPSSLAFYQLNGGQKKRMTSLSSTGVTITLTTTDDLAVAKKIAHSLIESKLAKCVQMDKTTSVYEWEGKVEESDEYR